MTSSNEPAAATANPRRAWLTAAVAGSAALGGGAIALRSRRGIEPSSSGSGERFPDVPLVTHSGERVHFYSDLVRGRIVFINMMYAQCSNRCPPMTQNLKRVHELLGPRAGRDIFMYSIGLQPETDRPDDLLAYMRINGVTGLGWTFLTGATKDVDRVRRSLGFFDRDPVIDSDITQHTGMLCIGNDALNRWCMTPALQQPELIVEALMAIDPRTRAAGRSFAREDAAWR